MDLIKKFRLENPFFLLAAPAESVNAVPQGAICLPVKHFDNARGEPAVRFGPGNPLVQVDQMALINASGG
jgi:hypothetical protein